jgi:hypothetical protein
MQYQTVHALFESENMYAGRVDDSSKTAFERPIMSTATYERLRPAFGLLTAMVDYSEHLLLRIMFAEVHNINGKQVLDSRYILRARDRKRYKSV